MILTLHDRVHDDDVVWQPLFGRRVGGGWGTTKSQSKKKKHSTAACASLRTTPEDELAVRFASTPKHVETQRKVRVLSFEPKHVLIRSHHHHHGMAQDSVSGEFSCGHRRSEILHILGKDDAQNDAVEGPPAIRRKENGTGNCSRRLRRWRPMLESSDLTEISCKAKEE